MDKWQLYMWDCKDRRQYDEKLRKGMPPLIITVAITGGIAGKEVNPNLPETPEEQADSTYECYKVGASSVHIHARDPKQGYAVASTDPDDYRRINKLVRERCPNIIIGNTTGGGANVPREAALKSIEALPEIASLNCGPLVVRATMKRRQPPLTGRDEDIYLDHVMPINFAETEVLAREMKERGIKPDLEVYNPSMFIVADNLMCQGLLERPYSFSVYFGKMFGVPATAQNLVATVAGFPPNSVWHAIGVDYVQVSITTMAIAMGGNVRVGFEDNVFYRRGELLRSNAQAVERVVRTANELERSIATPAQAREILGLSQTPRTYD